MTTYAEMHDILYDLRAQMATIHEAVMIADFTLDQKSLNEDGGTFFNKAKSAIASAARSVYAKIKQICAFIGRKLKEYLKRFTAGLTIGTFSVQNSDLHRLKETPALLEKALFLIDRDGTDRNITSQELSRFSTGMEEVRKNIRSMKETASKEQGEQMIKVSVLRFYIDTVEKLNGKLDAIASKLESSVDSPTENDTLRVQQIREVSRLTNDIASDILSISAFLGQVVKRAFNKVAAAVNDD